MGKLPATFRLLFGLLLLLNGCGAPSGNGRPEITAPPVKASSSPAEVAAVQEKVPGGKAASPTYEDFAAGEPLVLKRPPPPPPPGARPPAAAKKTSSPARTPRRAPSAVPPPPSYPQAGAALSPPSPVPVPPLQTVIQPRPGLASYPKAQPASSAAIKKAETASLALDHRIQSGQLRANFLGTGDLQEMVYFQLVNDTRQPIRVELAAGMILNPPGHEQVQPLLVTEDVSFTLKPGEERTGTLLSFCMDSRVPAPAYGEAVNYRFSTRTRDGGPEAVRAYHQAEKLVGSRPYSHAITQIAIWKALGQPVEEQHLLTLLGPAAKDPRVRREVLREVDRVLRSR